MSLIKQTLDQIQKGNKALEATVRRAIYQAEVELAAHLTAQAVQRSPVVGRTVASCLGPLGVGVAPNIQRLQRQAIKAAIKSGNALPNAERDLGDYLDEDDDIVTDDRLSDATPDLISGTTGRPETRSFSELAGDGDSSQERIEAAFGRHLCNLIENATSVLPGSSRRVAYGAYNNADHNADHNVEEKRAFSKSAKGAFRVGTLVKYKGKVGHVTSVDQDFDNCAITISDVTGETHMLVPMAHLTPIG